MIESISGIVRMFRRGQDILKMMSLMKEHSNFRSLCLYAETRWGGLYKMLYRFNVWLPTFFSLIHSDWQLTGTPASLKTKEMLANLLHSNDFDQKLKMALKISELFHLNLLQPESDRQSISDVCFHWMSLIREINKLQLP